MADFQGGKAFGQLKASQGKSLEEINQVYLDDEDYQDEEEYPDLRQTLTNYKEKFMEYDEDNSGDIDIMELKRMMEKLGQAKTHLELKKMIAEVDRCNSGTIVYNDFLYMMLGKKSSILKLILMFESAQKEKQVRSGHGAPKRDLSSLP